MNALENTPSVQVDVEGNVSLRGSSNFTVLINGKPSVLTGSEALEPIPASTIDNIEIITNPSAKYDPEGAAGIINVILKKNILSGFNGILNLSAVTGDRYSTDLNLNYKTKKYNLFLGLNWGDRTFEGSMKADRKMFSKDTTKIYQTNGDRKYERKGYRIKPGLDLYFSDKSTLSIFGEFGEFNRGRNSIGTTRRYTSPGSYDLLYRESNGSEREGTYYRGNVSFQHKFDDAGLHKIDMLFNYSFRDGVDTDAQEEILKKDDNLMLDKLVNKTKSDEKEKDNDIDIKLDYTRPMGGEGKLESGLMAKINREDEQFIFNDFDIATGQWNANDEFSSNLKFKRDVYALYTTYSNKWNALGYMLGIRGEQTNRETDREIEETPSTLNRFDYFPTIHLSYDLNKRDQLMASYSRRISRPRGRNLDPTPFYMNQYNIRIGNPDLKPEYTDSYELGMLKRFGRNMVSLESFYKITNNLITRVQELKEGETFIHTYKNLNKDFSLGLELMANLTLTKWWMLNVSGSLYNYKIEGELYGESIDKESTNYNGRVNSTFSFSLDSRLQLTGFYRGPSVTAQGERDDLFITNLSYRHQFFKKKLTATLSVMDIFQTMGFEVDSKGQAFESHFEMQRKSPIFQLTLSYKINNYKLDKRNRGDDGQEDGMDMDVQF